MSVTLHWDGLAEFKVDLEQLPESLAVDADAIVDAAANGAVSDIKKGYPRRSGSLQDHVFVSRLDKGKFTSARLVKNTAPLAFIFERGTRARHYFTKQKGVLHATGMMPPGNVFIPAVIKRRRAMNVQLKALLERHGLVVLGEAA
jgi:hypothetical protein